MLRKKKKQTKKNNNLGPADPRRTVIDTPSHCAHWPGCDVSSLPETRCQNCRKEEQKCWSIMINNVTQW